MDKRKCRQQMKESLSLIDEISLREMSFLISTNLFQLLSDLHVIQQKINVGAFAPIVNGSYKEPHIDLSYLERNESLTSYPSYDESKGLMIFKRARRNELVIKKDFGPEIWGPDLLATEIVPGVVLIPGVAFSHQGHRLGRGKGFYDKYLNQYCGIKIGVCFSVQLLESIPTEKHDVAVDYIVNEEKVITCKNA